MMKKSLLIAFGVAAAYNLIMSILGIGVVLQATGPLGFLISTVGAVILTFLPFSTSMIVARSGRLYTFLKCAVVLVIIVNLFCVFVGNFAYLVSNRTMGQTSAFSWAEVFKNTDYAKIGLIALLTAFAAMASTAVSFLRHEEDDEDDLDFLRSRKPPIEKKHSETKV